MKLFRTIMVILLVVAFGAVTLGNRNGMTIYDVTNLLYQWGQTFDKIETGSTGIAIIDTILQWAPVRWVVVTLTFFTFAGSFALQLFLFWWG